MQTNSNKRANEIIGGTLGMSLSEINEYRYQATRTTIPIYAVGNTYYCCPRQYQTPPKLDGIKWQPHKDQFWAERSNRVMYSADVGEGSK